MVNKKNHSSSESDAPQRRRGRHASKNRVPLSKEERRAGNAQYERERRNETAEVMSQLFKTANCDPDNQTSSESDAPQRRRGRPAGKNRVPLSKEERRAGNAQYERERRNETAEVMSQLIEAANCDPDNQTSSESDAPQRRRGRPAGKNRVPLSKEERRARNAQYERERRNETAEVMSQLIEAANCNPDISNAELLATVISRIQRATRNKSEDITELQRINNNLEEQIASIQDRLGLDDAAFELLVDEDTDTQTAGPHSSSKRRTNKKCDSENDNSRKQRNKRKRSERQSSESIQQEKRTKTRSETCSVDSGIEIREDTVSPPAVCVRDPNNIQYLVKTEKHQLPVEITEEQGESQAHMELQSELYNQIYNSVPQCSAELISEFVASLSVESQSHPAIETLMRSLIKVPSIVPPQQVPPDSQEVTQTELTTQQKVKLPCDFNIKNECDFLQQDGDQELTLDFLIDPETGLLSDWIS